MWNSLFLIPSLPYNCNWRVDEQEELNSFCFYRKIDSLSGKPIFVSKKMFWTFFQKTEQFLKKEVQEQRNNSCFKQTNICLGTEVIEKRRDIFTEKVPDQEHKNRSKMIHFPLFWAQKKKTKYLFFFWLFLSFFFVLFSQVFFFRKWLRIERHKPVSPFSIWNPSPTTSISNSFFLFFPSLLSFFFLSLSLPLPLPLSLSLRFVHNKSDI